MLRPDIRIGPETSDGKPLVTAAVFPGDQNPYFCGEGDDIANGARGGGFAFEVDQPAAGDHTFEWQFIDCAYIDGGSARIFGGAKGDYVNMLLVAPQTPAPTSNPGAGNCNLVAVTGGNIIVPAPLSDGSHDVDVTTALNANLDSKASGKPTKVTAAVPVPAVVVDADGEDQPDGYWDWDETTGEITAAIGAGGEKEGFWNLFDFEILLTKWVSGWRLWDLGSKVVEHRFEVPVKARKILPHWICRAVYHKEAAGSLQGTWGLFMGRSHTT